MRLRELSLGDRTIFDRFLNKARHELAVYNFADIYIWRKLFDISWCLINEGLYVFFKDKTAAFLYLSPLGEKDPKALERAFCSMDEFNKNSSFSRIENAEEGELSFYEGLGYLCRQSSCDYLCKRAEIAGLRGNNFKSKRSSLNYFRKHYRYEYVPYMPKYKDACFELYDLWMNQRKNPERLYQYMLSDAKICLREALDNYKELKLTGRLVAVEGRLRGFTFGYRLNPGTFCILFEVTDLTIKGLAQFIFQRFAQELKGYKYINVMDDSGIENLKKVKLSYKPVRLLPSYTVKRRDA